MIYLYLSHHYQRSKLNSLAPSPSPPVQNPNNILYLQKAQCLLKLFESGIKDIAELCLVYQINSLIINPKVIDTVLKKAGPEELIEERGVLQDKVQDLLF